MRWLKITELSKFVDSGVLPFLQGHGGASNIKIGTDLKNRFNLRVRKQVHREGMIKHGLHFEHAGSLLDEI